MTVKIINDHSYFHQLFVRHYGINYIGFVYDYDKLVLLIYQSYATFIRL